MSLPIICLMGPTACGKTNIAVELVQKFPLEIVSVDSAMVYREMNIGTAKPSQEILEIAPHGLIDLCNPSENYSVAQFCDDASQVIVDIHSRQKIPLLVGGTMMYFHALLNGLAELPAADKKLRSQLTEEAKQRGWPILHEKLKQLDPLFAARIHPNDSQRIQRALEVIYLSGKKITELQQDNTFYLKNKKIFQFGLCPQNRFILHEKISLRFKSMLKQGLVDEVQNLLKKYSLTLKLPSMRAVGYKQVFLYLKGQLTREEMETRSIIATRQLAKRQLTWLRHWKKIDVWFESESNQLLEKISKRISERISELI